MKLRRWKRPEATRIGAEHAAPRLRRTVRSSAPAWTAIVLGKKPRQRDARAGIGVQPQRRERLLRQQAAAGGDGRTAADRASRRPAPHSGSLSECASIQSRRARQAVDRLVKPQRRPAERRIVGGVHRLDDAAQFAEIGVDHRAAVERQLAGDEIDRLDAVGAFVDRGDAGVAINAARRRSPR